MVVERTPATRTVLGVVSHHAQVVNNFRSTSGRTRARGCRLVSLVLLSSPLCPSSGFPLFVLAVITFLGRLDPFGSRVTILVTIWTMAHALRLRTDCTAAIKALGFVSPACHRAQSVVVRLARDEVVWNRVPPRDRSVTRHGSYLRSRSSLRARLSCGRRNPTSLELAQWTRGWRSFRGTVGAEPVADSRAVSGIGPASWT